mmetsp:Transcript_99493/g.290468  ORF Transcript_99493/g.290468 Transcript_99493/m.290468 type:complete len:222 (+) Transcript_99493:472-1137(+)
MAAARTSSESCAQLISQMPPASLRSTSHALFVSQSPFPVRPSFLAARHSAAESSAQGLSHGRIACSFLAADGRHEKLSNPRSSAAARCSLERPTQSRPKTSDTRSSQSCALMMPSCLAELSSCWLSAAHAFSLAGSTNSSTASMEAASPRRARSSSTVSLPSRHSAARRTLACAFLASSPTELSAHVREPFGSVSTVTLSLWSVSSKVKKRPPSASALCST